MIKPEQLAKAGKERSHQVALFCWAALMSTRYPALKLMFKIKNEESSGSAIRGAMAKAEGVKPGVADLFLPHAAHGAHGAFIEMKKPGAGKQSPAQKQFQYQVEAEGYKYCLAYGWEQAKDFLIDYLTN